ncbi:Na+/H+ antiporter subunit E [Cypionkella sp.]|uniref:Na+/H+ antiporter subunit E n=1 Tax=Cypionkella sp. TaxID=2811411 RepID=UPI0037525DE1
MHKLFPHPYLSATLVLTWVLLMDSIGPGALLMGGFLGVVIPLLTAPYWPEHAAMKHPLRLIAYIGLVLGDVIVSSIQVAAIILFKPADQIQSAWICVPIDLPSPEAQALLAGTITMTPGTLTADFAADGKSLLIHSLHAPDPDAVRAEIKSRYEARLKRIFT